MNDHARAEALTFQGTRTEETGATVTVRVGDGPARRLHMPRLVAHLERRHSPDGFEWGYLGSGPAELARAILCECYLRRSDSPNQGVRQAAIYMAFKEDVVARLPREGWTLAGADVAKWVKARDAVESAFK